MATGTVKWFNDANSYGFGAPGDGGKDVFVHHTLDRCAVCGERAGSASVEDTNGWRWFNNGRGGLVPLCSTCPVPAELFGSTSSGATGATSQPRSGRPKPWHRAQKAARVSAND